MWILQWFIKIIKVMSMRQVFKATFNRAYSGILLLESINFDRQF